VIGGVDHPRDDVGMRGLAIVVMLAGCGRIGFGFGDDGAPADGGAVDDTIRLDLLAGDTGGFGNADGVGPAARFNAPTAVAVDSAGNIYVTDHFCATVRKITPDGTVTTFAGTAGLPGASDGVGRAARFYFPMGVAVDGAGNVYVVDQGNRALRKITPDGTVTTVVNGAAKWASPAGVAVGRDGNIYVADGGAQVIRKVTPAGVDSVFAGSPGLQGTTDASGGAARFYFPTGLAVDGAGNLLVADQSNHTIRQIDASANVTTLAGVGGVLGDTDGPAAQAHFTLPIWVAVDGAGTIYLTDGNARIRRITGGVVDSIAGTSVSIGASDGTGEAAQFSSQDGVAVDGAGNVIVADQFNRIIRKITPAGVVTTLAGAATKAGEDNGVGSAARFNGPAGVAADLAGNLYVADEDNSAIRKITPEGAVSTFADQASAGLQGPTGVAVDRAGNVFVVDIGSTLRKITPTGAMTLVAGSASVNGSADGTGAGAQFWSPAGVTIDRTGTLYVADQGNNAVRKVTADGVVTTLAGAASTAGSTDGTGAAARFDDLTDVAADAAGNLYVADRDNHIIRKVTPAGEVTTFAGTAMMFGYADGTGADARFHTPTGVAVDGKGNVYVADQGNAVIRQITPAGVVTTFAGTPGVAGIVLGTAPRFALPERLAIVGDALVITDNNAVLALRHAIR
jgi:sugar lactone lactonase YvrE